MIELWDEKTPLPDSDNAEFPEQIEYITVHKGIKDHYEFSLGAAVEYFRGRLFVAWGTSRKVENDSGSIMAYKYSDDDGRTWSDFKTIAPGSNGSYANSHGTFFIHENNLYAFSPSARLGEKNPDFMYPDLCMQLYKYQFDQDEWTFIDTVNTDYFWPLCEPMKLENGRILMAGVDCKYTRTAESAIVLNEGNVEGRWETVRINSGYKGYIWAESTVLQFKEKLRLIARYNDKREVAIVSDSYDYGKSWTKLEESNLPMADAKPYGGTLSNGQKYFIFNYPSEKGYRAELVIAVSKTDQDNFSKMFWLYNGYGKQPSFDGGTMGYHYPYAVERNGKLYIAITINKEDTELCVIPLDSLMI